MATHRLKVDPPIWPSILRREKTAEIRFDDRGYEVGDTLILYQFDRERGEQVGTEECVRQVTHILKGGQYGLEPGYVMMSMY